MLPNRYTATLFPIVLEICVWVLRFRRSTQRALFTPHSTLLDGQRGHHLLRGAINRPSGQFNASLS